MKFRILKAEHEDLDDAAKAILAHVSALRDGGSSSRYDPFPAMRLLFARKVGSHCSAEIEIVRDFLKNHPEVAKEKAHVVRLYHEVLLAWRGSLMECNANWQSSRVIQDPAGFLDAFTPIAEAMFHRIRWEEQAFFPEVLGRAIAHA